MDADAWDAILKAIAPKARSDKEWAHAYATLLVANSLDRWGEGITAELARIADGLGAAREEAEDTGEERSE